MASSMRAVPADCYRLYLLHGQLNLRIRPEDASDPRPAAVTAALQGEGRGRGQEVLLGAKPAPCQGHRSPPR